MTNAKEVKGEYELNLEIAGQLQAGIGNGGKVIAHYNSGSPATLWQNPTNFNSSGLNHSQPFTPPPGASTVKFGYEVTMDKGWLAYGNASFTYLIDAYTTP